MRRHLIAMRGLSACLCLVIATRADDKKPKEIKGWGEATDPDGDCKIEEKKGKLTIKVPGSVHDLSPGQKDEKKRFNAPRCAARGRRRLRGLREGDRGLETGREEPRGQHLPLQRGGAFGLGADGEFVRLERNVWMADEMAVSYTSPSCMIATAGKWVTRGLPRGVLQGPLHLAVH